MSKLTLMVCPHDTVHNSQGWYRLVQYLTSRLDAELRFDLALDFSDFNERLPGADLVYANPSDTLKLIDGRGFQALARPAGRFDEALLVAGAEAGSPTLADLNGAVIASVLNLLPTRLALRLLVRQGVTPASLAGCDSWLSVVRSVWDGQTPYGILYRDAYDDLSPQGKGMVQLLASTDERVAFHSLCLSPALAAEAPALAETLLGMAQEPAGREVLEDLGIPAWEPVPAEAIVAMRAVLI